MTASPCCPIRSWKKSPRARLPVCRPISVNMLPKWTKCSLATIGGVNVGTASRPSRVWVRYRLQWPSVESGPRCGLSGSAHVIWSQSVPYQATSTRPASPAAAHAKTFVRSPGVGICTGVVHVTPSSADEDQYSSVSPLTSPELPQLVPQWMTGACSHTANRFPARSMARVGKLAPDLNPDPPSAFEVGNVVTSESVQDRPEGSVVTGTFSHFASRMAVLRLFGWTTKISWVMGLTSTLPMIPSSHGPVMRLEGPYWTPAVLPGAPGAGDRAMTSWFAAVSTPSHTCGPEPPTTL